MAKNFFFVPGMCDISREDFGNFDIAVEIACYNALDNRWTIVSADVMDSDECDALIEDFKRQHRRARVERVNMYTPDEFMEMFGGEDEQLTYYFEVEHGCLYPDQDVEIFDTLDEAMECAKAFDLEAFARLHDESGDAGQYYAVAVHEWRAPLVDGEIDRTRADLICVHYFKCI